MNRLSLFVPSAFAFGLSAVPVTAEPVSSTAEIAGMWDLPRKSAQFKFQLQATASGATYKITRLNARCSYVIAPSGENGVFDSYPIKGQKCPAGRTVIQNDGDELVIKTPVAWQKDPVRMVQVGGPDNSPRQYPSVTVRGVALGMSMDEARNLLTSDGMQVETKGASNRVLRGVKGLDGRYVQASLSYGGEFAGTSAVEETLGIFAAEGSEKVDVILRYWAPALPNAPRGDTFLSALQETYGNPHNADGSGRLRILSWYFGPNGHGGNDAPQACAQKPTRDHRVAAILFDSLTFLPSTGRAALDGSSTRSNLHPQTGCGYTLRYHVRVNDDGTLMNAESIFYDHRTIANQIWTETSEPLDDKIKRALQSISASGSNASKL